MSMTRRKQLEHKAELRREWAEKRRSKAETAYNAGKRISDQIPFGQPILIGHHSERHAKADVKRIDNAMRAYSESTTMAKHHEEKADGIETQLETTIFSDDQDAIEALQAKIDKAEKRQEAMKKVNAIVRRKPKNQMTPDKIEELAALGFIEAEAIGFFTPDFCGRIGIPSYSLSNNNANIRRMKERIKFIGIQDDRKAKAEESPNGITIEGREWVRVTFAEKPNRSVIDALKAAGFRWGGGSWTGKRENLPAGLAPAEHDPEIVPDTESLRQRLIGGGIEKPQPAKWNPDPSSKTHQRVLFSGMDLLDGQADLFPTDGEPERSN